MRKIPNYQKMVSMIRRHWGKYLLLALPFIPAIVLGVVGLSTQILFTFDQARDAFEALGIAHGDIKILGPSTDIPGVHHGVLWYYLLSLPYLLSRGDPQIVATFFFIVMLLTIPCTGLLSMRIFKNTKIAYVAMLLYAYSPLFQAFSRWLSNPMYTLLVIPPLLFCLWEYLSKPRILPAIFLGISFGLLIQSDFAFVVFLVLLPIYFLIFRIPFTLSHFGYFVIALVITLSSYILAEVRFHGQAMRGIFHFLVSGGHSLSEHPATQILQIFQKQYQLSSYTVPLHNLILTGCIGIALLVYCVYKRERLEKKPLWFLLLWLSNILIFQFFQSGIIQSAFILGPSLVVFILLLSYIFVTILSKKILIVVVIVLLCLQTLTTVTWLHDKFSPFMVQNGMYLINEKKVVDYTYDTSHSREFSINTVSNPLFINTTWAFLYEYYGQKKYGYLPSFAGKDQKGYLGNLSSVTQRTPTLFLIEEPGPGIPPLYYQIAEGEMNDYSKVAEKKKIGEFIVEKRLRSKK